MHYMILTDALIAYAKKRGYLDLARDMEKVQPFVRFTMLNEKEISFYIPDLPRSSYDGCEFQEWEDMPNCHRLRIWSVHDPPSVLKEFRELLLRTKNDIDLEVDVPGENWKAIHEIGFSDGKQVAYHRKDGYRCFCPSSEDFDYGVEITVPEYKSEVKTLYEATLKRARELIEKHLNDNGIPEDVRRDLGF